MSIQQFTGLNVALTTAGNEYSLVIPPGAMDVQLKLRDATKTLKIYGVSVGNGGSPANYITLAAGQVLSFRTKQGGQTIYVMPADNTQVLEACYFIDN